VKLKEIKKIKQFINETFDSDIMADNRKLNNVFGRMAFVNLILSVSKHTSLEKIGSFLNRDHATIVYYQKTHESEIVNNAYYREKYKVICKKFPKSDFDKKETELTVSQIGFRRGSGKPIFYGLNSKYTLNGNHFSTKQLRAIADYIDANPEIL